MNGLLLLVFSNDFRWDRSWSSVRLNLFDIRSITCRRSLSCFIQSCYLLNEFFFFLFFFFSIWVFFHEHSLFTGQQEKGEGIFLTPFYHFHPLHRHLDIGRAITTESSPLHIGSSRTGTGNLTFPSASR